jgi:hypothetical protein
VAYIQHHRDRYFGQSQGAAIVNANGVVVRGGRAPGVPQGDEAKDGVPGIATEMFAIGLQVSAEPRMSIVQNGMPRVLEAVDEQGRSLAMPEEPGAAGRFPAAGVYSHFGGSLVPVQIPLRLARERGGFVKTLRVAIPITAASRKEVPFVVPLADAKGRTFENDRITIQVDDIVPDPRQPTTSIELTVRIRTEETGNVGPGRQHLEAMVFRNHPGGGQSQVEIVDAQGRPYTQWMSQNPQPGRDGLRMSLRLIQTEGVGPPAELRYYDIARTETEVTFELSDIPMP